MSNKYDHKRFNRNIDKHYLEWHPDYIKFKKLTGGLDGGDIFYYEEYLHGELHKIKSKITKNRKKQEN